MLEHLEIRNFALIENLAIDFHEGFNVITGETGAGKSIILGALGLLMGEKADASAIRTGAEEMTVNAVVSIPKDHEILSWLKEHEAEPEDGTIIIKRTVKQNGRSVINVQGQLFTRQELTYLADSITDMHGQSEHQSLLLTDKQRKIIDSYAGNDNLLKQCSELYHKVNELKKQKEDILKALEEAKKQEDYLRFALEEIESAKIETEEEDVQLKEKVQVFAQFENIYENLTICGDKLKEINSLFYDSSNFLAKAAKCDTDLNEKVGRMESLRIESQDLASELKDYIGNINYSEDVINQMQDRLATLQKLKRKYGPGLTDVLKFKEQAEEKLDMAQNSELHLDKCEKELKKSLQDYKQIAHELDNKRRESSNNLQSSIETTLKTLGMPNATFTIKVEAFEDKFTINGINEITFMISANPGEPEKELKEIASGGELSRVMLALKTVLAKEDTIQTQVFDEVDSGIGGAVALSLANCIKDLSRLKQVIAITHLATIASKADSQFVVTKTVENGRTYSHLVQVKGEERVHEIARMLSGDEDSVTVEHARTMLNSLNE